MGMGYVSLICRTRSESHTEMNTGSQIGDKLTYEQLQVFRIFR